MNDMPEKIMAWPHFNAGVTGQWSANTYDDERATPYVRIDREANLEPTDLTDKAEAWNAISEKNAEIVRLSDLVIKNRDEADENARIAAGALKELVDLREQLADMTRQRDAARAGALEEGLEAVRRAVEG